MSIKKPNIDEFNDLQFKKLENKAAIALETTLKLLETIKQSPALNGGFDSLLIKVGKIEEGQFSLSSKIDLIHDALYNPDSGLYARVKDAARAEEVEQVEKDVQILKLWKDHEDKSIERELQVADENDKLVKNHDLQLKDLMEFKQRAGTIFRWGLMTLGTGIASLLGKLIYDFLAGHIKYV